MSHVGIHEDSLPLLPLDLDHVEPVVAAVDHTAYEGHPYAAAFPLMEGEDFAGLVVDVREHGLREPILLYEGLVLDGRNRLRACIDAGVQPRFVTFNGHDPVAYIVSLNLRRRHLDSSQRSMIAARLATLTVGTNQHTKQAAGSQAPSQSQAANMLNVSRDSVQKARIVLQRGAVDLQRAVDQGQVSVSTAVELALAHPTWQVNVLALTHDEIIEEAAKLKRERKISRMSQRCSTSRLNLFAQLNVDVPNDEKEHFGAIIKTGIDAIQQIDRAMARAIWSVKTRGTPRKEGIKQYLAEIEAMPARIEKLLEHFAAATRISSNADACAGQVQVMGSSTSDKSVFK